MTGKAIKITGKVFDIHSTQFLMFTKQSYGVWMDGTCYVNVKGTMPSNIINDDIVTIYAVVDGKKDYATAAGGSNLVPELTVYPENIVLNTKS